MYPGKSGNYSDFIIERFILAIHFTGQKYGIIDKDRCFSGSNVAITRYDRGWVKKKGSGK